MSKKRVLFSDEARDKIITGIDKLADIVEVTLGPSGQNVFIDKKFGGPQSVRDGVTIAKEIEFEDSVENIGAQLIKEAASKANDRAGDGTTTATVLTRSMVKESRRVIAAGAHARKVKSGMEVTVSALIDELRSQAQTVSGRTQIKQVATVAAGNDEIIGEMIAEAMDKVGRDGVITVEEGKALKTELKIVEGMQFDKGYISPYFVTNSERQEAELKDAFVLLCEKKINLISDLVPLLEKIARTGKPLLIIAEDIEGEALATLVVNKLRQVLNVCAIKAPGFGDRRKAMLQDIAILTGGEVISEDLGYKLENVTIEQLGTVDRALITKENTTLVVDIPDDRKEAVEGRKRQILAEIGQSTSDYDKEKLQERLAKLSGGVATIQIGAATESELKDKKLRVEDAVHATKAACEEGILPGGGVALVRAQQAVEAKLLKELESDAATGAKIILRAVEGPARKLAENAGEESSVIIQKLKEEKDKNIGFNAATGEFVNMIENGIVDPLKVTRTALLVASSIACLITETNAVVYDAPEPAGSPSAGPAGMEGMGGMGGMM